MRGIRWYLREISGTAGYERHCRRHRERHPGEPVPTRRESENHRSLHSRTPVNPVMGHSNS